MQHWSTIAAIPGQPAMANGSTIPMVDRLIPGSIDFTAFNATGYVRPNAPSNVLSGSSMHSAPTPYNHHQTIGYFHPALSVGAAPQSVVEPGISGRQFQNASLNPSYQLAHFQQPGSVSQSLSLPHAQVPYGQSLSYLPSLVTAMGNGALGPGHQYASVHAGQHPPQHQPQQQQQQQQHTMAMANALPVRQFDTLKHFGSLAQNQHARRNKPMITSKTNLYISGLNESDTDDTVRALVENIVQPKSCKAMLTAGKCKGSGFIDCATEEDAEKAKIHIMECSKAKGNRKLSVKYAFENEKDTLNVYVRNLPRVGFTKEMLEEMFREFGHVTSVKLHETSAGLTGIGFVRFSTALEAEKAVEHMNESRQIVGDSDKPIICKLADKAGPRSRPIAISPQIHVAQAAVAAAVAASGMHHHHHHPSIGRGAVNNPNAFQSSQQQQQQQHHQQQQHQHQSYQLPTQLVQQQQQQQNSALVMSNMHSSSNHARNILLSQALLPNGATGVANASAIPMSFASVGPNGVVSTHQVAAAVAGGGQINTTNNQSSLYRTGPQTVTPAQLSTSVAPSGQLVLGVTPSSPAATDVYMGRSKAPPQSIVINPSSANEVLAYDIANGGSPLAVVSTTTMMHGTAAIVTNAYHAGMVFGPKTVQVPTSFSVPIYTDDSLSNNHLSTSPDKSAFATLSLYPNQDGISCSTTVDTSSTTHCAVDLVASQLEMLAAHSSDNIEQECDENKIVSLAGDAICQTSSAEADVRTSVAIESPSSDSSTATSTTTSGASARLYNDVNGSSQTATTTKSVKPAVAEQKASTNGNRQLSDVDNGTATTTTISGNRRKKTSPYSSSNRQHGGVVNNSDSPTPNATAEVVNSAIHLPAVLNHPSLP